MKTMIVALLAIVLAGCFSDDELSELRSRRDQWHRSGMSFYSFEFQALCFCLEEFNQPVSVVVQNDSIVSVTVIQSRSPVIESIHNWKTIDDLFDIAENAVREAAEFHIDYHPQLGYPTRIEIDYFSDAVDDEFVYKAGNLKTYKLDKD